MVLKVRQTPGDGQGSAPRVSDLASLGVVVSGRGVWESACPSSWVIGLYFPGITCWEPTAYTIWEQVRGTGAASWWATLDSGQVSPPLHSGPAQSTWSRRGADQGPQLCDWTVSFSEDPLAFQVCILEFETLESCSNRVTARPSEVKEFCTFEEAGFALCFLVRVGHDHGGCRKSSS